MSHKPCPKRKYDKDLWKNRRKEKETKKKRMKKGDMCMKLIK